MENQQNLEEFDLQQKIKQTDRESHIMNIWFSLFKISKPDNNYEFRKRTNLYEKNHYRCSIVNPDHNQQIIILRILDNKILIRMVDEYATEEDLLLYYNITKSVNEMIKSFNPIYEK